MHAHPTEIGGSAFAGLPMTLGHGRGVIAREREGIAVAQMSARRGQAAEVAEVCRATWGIEPPNAPRRVARGDIGIAGLAPRTWIATHESAGNAFVPSLQALLGPCASIADQSDAQVMLRLTGPAVRASLAKLIPIDLHARSFHINDVAQSVCGYVNITLWRLEDTAVGEPTFEVWAGRSFAVSLYRAIAHGAAEFGFVREQGRPADAGSRTA